VRLEQAGRVAEAEQAGGRVCAIVHGLEVFANVVVRVGYEFGISGPEPDGCVGHDRIVEIGWKGSLARAEGERGRKAPD